MKLLFVTSSLNTKWLNYSQQLIANGFPDAKRIVIDGTENWSPLRFVDELQAYRDYDFVIHIDEDCFLLEPDQLRTVLEELQTKPKVVMAGSPDGGMPYRGHNYYACNLFFVIIKPAMLCDLLESTPQWKSLRWNSKYEVSNTFEDYEFWNRENQRLDNFERYYPLFWLVLENNFRIQYLSGTLNVRYSSTDLFAENCDRPFARHMWFARDWKENKVTRNGRTNLDRYNLHESEVLIPATSTRSKQNVE